MRRAQGNSNQHAHPSVTPAPAAHGASVVITVPAQTVNPHPNGFFTTTHHHQPPGQHQHSQQHHHQQPPGQHQHSHQHPAPNTHTHNPW